MIFKFDELTEIKKSANLITRWKTFRLFWMGNQGNSWYPLWQVRDTYSNARSERACLFLFDQNNSKVLEFYLLVRARLRHIQIMMLARKLVSLHISRQLQQNQPSFFFCSVFVLSRCSFQFDWREIHFTCRVEFVNVLKLVCVSWVFFKYHKRLQNIYSHSLAQYWVTHVDCFQ